MEGVTIYRRLEWVFGWTLRGVERCYQLHSITLSIRRYHKLSNVTDQTSRCREFSRIYNYLFSIHHLPINSQFISNPFPSPCDHQTANPPLFNCLGSPAASKVPFGNLLNACAVVLPGAINATLLPSTCPKNAVVSLLYPFTPNNVLPHSKLTVLGLN
jgi:hypothetical protein